MRRPFIDAFTSSIAQRLDFVAEQKNLFHSTAVVNERLGEEATSFFFYLKNSLPWPEWTKLADVLVGKGYADLCITYGDDKYSFSIDEELPQKFLKAADAFLSFSRDCKDILRLLAKKNIEVVVLNWSPFLYKNGDNLTRRMKLYLSSEGSNEFEREKALTVDII